MPALNRDRVRHRMAKLGFKFIKPLADAAGLEYGTVRNAITCTTPPYPLHLADIYRLAESLRDKGEKVEKVVADILANEGDGTPDQPPEKKTKDTQAPTRRQEREKSTGPRRTTDKARVA